MNTAEIIARVKELGNDAFIPVTLIALYDNGKAAYGKATLYYSNRTFPLPVELGQGVLVAHHLIGDAQFLFSDNQVGLSREDVPAQNAPFDWTLNPPNNIFFDWNSSPFFRRNFQHVKLRIHIMSAALEATFTTDNNESFKFFLADGAENLLHGYVGGTTLRGSNKFTAFLLA